MGVRQEIPERDKLKTDGRKGKAMKIEELKLSDRKAVEKRMMDIFRGSLGMTDGPMNSFRHMFWS